MNNTLIKKKGFGTLPVFLTTISTILGAILFLRFGYAVGHVGFWGAIGIIVIGHIVTISTAMAVSEIATNQKVEGGGAYFIISRSFGLNIGAAIGVALFLAQAVSVAFYVIAFAEAFSPVLDWLRTKGIVINDLRFISIPAMGLLTWLILKKGADLGMKALYFVCGILFIAIVLFFLGDSGYEAPAQRMSQKILNPDSFFYVFTIIFPAFTGIAAGLGLSGDLEDPKKSIPLGTLSATIFGMIVYVFITYHLTYSASPEDLANDQFIMSKIALWGPAIPIGLAAATISSALGSIMIAPRTLQALGGDKIFPSALLNRWTSKENKRSNEPINATLVTCVIAFVFIAMGDVNFVAEIISMFFMVTYGAICLVSFLEHFAADPAYRPTFKSKWYLSLIGAIACFWLIFKMNFTYAVLSLSIMGFIYFIVTYFNNEKKALSKIFQGVIFQLSRNLQLFLQKSNTDVEENDWRPAVVCISKNYFERLDAFDLLRWISSKYGFGTYIHQIDGYLSKETGDKSKEMVSDLINVTKNTKSKIFFGTVVSPSTTTAIAQVMQLPGITGKPNNTMLFEYSRQEENSESLHDFVSNFGLMKSMKFDLFLLSVSQRGFAFKKNIDIWLTSGDYENANLMILTAFIILGDTDWKKGEIKLHIISEKSSIREQRLELIEKIKEGRLPISINNIEIIQKKETKSNKDLICEHSGRADLTIIGFRQEALKKQGKEIFSGYDKLGNILFVNSTSEIEIK